jgi:phosphoadenosine phosphosulfate reductase
MEASDLLYMMIKEEFEGEIALVSSFGAGSALLLAIVAEVDNTVPILFLDTQKHFPETLEYVETIQSKLNLKNLQIIKPREDLLSNIDPEGELWASQPNRCCWLRKVEPLKRTLDASPYRALITGRKRYQTAQRADMESIEMNEDGRFRVNPMAFWTKERIAEEFIKRGLPEHPLVAKGYPSIGCAPCTQPVKEGEDERAGRWAHTAELPGGEQKVECGIHLEGMPEKPDWNI